MFDGTARAFKTFEVGRYDSCNYRISCKYQKNIYSERSLREKSPSWKIFRQSRQVKSSEKLYGEIPMKSIQEECYKEKGVKENIP